MPCNAAKTLNKGTTISFSVPGLALATPFLWECGEKGFAHQADARVETNIGSMPGSPSPAHVTLNLLLASLIRAPLDIIVGSDEIVHLDNPVDLACWQVHLVAGEQALPVAGTGD